jgi:hypothetical protein
MKRASIPRTEKIKDSENREERKGAKSKEGKGSESRAELKS